MIAPPDKTRKVHMVTERLNPNERIDCEYGNDMTLAEWAQQECDRWWEKNYRKAWVDVIPDLSGHIAIFTDSYDHVELSKDE